MGSRCGPHGRSALDGATCLSWRDYSSKLKLAAYESVTDEPSDEPDEPNKLNELNQPMNPYDFAEQKKVSIRQVLDFVSLANPLGPSEKAKHAMRKALKAVQVTPDWESRYLRRYLARTEGIHPENLLFGHGSTHLLNLLFAVHRPGKVFVPAPVPHHYEEVITRHGAATVSVPLQWSNQPTADVDRLRSVLQRADLVLLSSPHLLTGVAIPPATLEAIVGSIGPGAVGSDGLIVIDEALIEFAQAPSIARKVTTMSNVAVLRTFSLFHSLQGLRLGYFIASPAIIERMTGLVDPAPVSNVALAGALASLRDKGYYRRTVEHLHAEKAYFLQKLGTMQGVELVDSECNVLIIRFSKPAPDIEARLASRNILIEGFTDAKGDRCLRIPIRRRRENARLVRTLLHITAGGRTETEV